MIRSFKKNSNKANFLGNDEQESGSGFNEHDISLGPTPLDLENFLPWACAKVCRSTHVIIEREADKYVSAKAAKPKKTVKSETFITRSETSKTECLKKMDEEGLSDKVIKITATYSGDHVIKLNFSQCDQIPRVVIRILGLIIKFHPQLTTIVISKGLNVYVVSEIFTMLHDQCNLSSLCFDGCVLPNQPLGNYYTLLDPASQLTELSLARCALGDDMLELICERLVYPLPASTTLAILTLSSNNITDVGVEALGQCLRSNRTLKYINLADNRITNKGMEAILNPLLKFKLSEEEIITSAARSMSYWRNKIEIINGILLKWSTPSGRSPVNVKRKPAMKLPKQQTDKDERYKQAELIATSSLGEFKDPFAPSQCETVNGQQFCYGNSILCYLNISYNHLDISALRKILEVLIYQTRDLSTGIINLRLDGNLLPINCQEINDINDILEYKLNILSKSKLGKKKG